MKHRPKELHGVIGASRVVHATGMKVTIGNRVIHNTIDPWASKDLLMIKHLFYASLAGKVDYRSFLETIGLYDVPESLDGLNKLKMTDSAIHGVRCCYKATRRVEQTDPLPVFSYGTLRAIHEMRRLLSVGMRLRLQ